jgi:hypothetical protein
MAVLDWTTTTRVKAASNLFAANLSTEAIADLGTLITSVSAMLENQLSRAVKVGAQVESRRCPMRARFSLKNGPAASITSVRFSTSGLFSRDAVTLTSSAYEIEAGGEALLIPDYAGAGGYLSVAYSGGMAADTAAFYTDYPDLERACIQQVIYTWSRRASLGRNSTDLGNGTTQWVGDLDLLAAVVTAISPYAHKWAIA